MDAGKKIQVINSVAYPEFVNDQPILGIDILWFGIKRKLVAVLDFQPLIQDDDYFLRYYEGLKLLKSRFEDFNTNKTINIYDSNQYFSPWVLFYSGNFDNLETSLSEVLGEFLHTYWSINKIKSTTYKKLTPREVNKLHINYDIYSAERDPAHGLFKSYFGKEWADRYMNNFLFPLSTSKL